MVWVVCHPQHLVLSFACVAGLGPPFGMRLVPAQAASVKLQAASDKHQATSWLTSVKLCAITEG